MKQSEEREGSAAQEPESHAIKVHCPHLDDNMRPAFELLNMKCPLGEDGKCYMCKQNEGCEIDLSDTEGTVFSYGSWPGECRGKEKV